MNNFLFYILLLISLSLYYATQIHILDLNRKKRKLVGDIQGNANSTFTKVCEKVMGSYNFMGRKGLDIYKYCKKEGYELLGKNNTLIRQNSPFCFSNLNAFFCKYQIIELKSKKTNFKPRTCADQNALKLILSIIQGCIKVNIVLSKEVLTNSPKKFSICPSLSMKTYKVQNKFEFCEGAEKKTVIKGRDRTTIEYKQITERFKSNCKRVVEMYNACIDGDNIIFPHSNYRKCFSEFNSLYVCSNIKKNQKYEKDVCANFVLPSLAYTNSIKSIYGRDPKFYCEGYENHIIKNYNKFINEMGEKEEDLDSKIVKIEKVKRNNVILKKFSEDLLGHLIDFNVLWKEFYPEFTLAYKKREKLYPSEFMILEKMRTSFDRFYPYAAHLNKLIQDKIFLSADFSNLSDSIKAYYEKASDNMIDSKKYIAQYKKVLVNYNSKFNHMKNPEKKSNKTSISNIKFNKTNSSSNSKKNSKTKKVEEGEKLMESQSTIKLSLVIKRDEIYAFQNQYVSIQIYLKSFLKFVMKKIIETDENNEKLKFKYSDEIDRLKVRIGFLNNQKQKLFEYMLE